MTFSFTYLIQGAALLCCSFFFTPQSRAQDFRGGLLLGGVTSQISGDNLSGFDKIGLSGGFYVNVPFSEKMSAQMELLFVQKGSRKNADLDNGDFNSYLLRLNYIEIPLSVDYKIANFHLRAGFYGGVLMGWSEENQNGPITILDQNQQALEFNRFDFGWVTGVDYHFSDAAYLSARFTNSFIPVRKHPSGVTLNQALATPFAEINAGQYNSAIQIMLGIQF